MCKQLETGQSPPPPLPPPPLPQLSSLGSSSEDRTRLEEMGSEVAQLRERMSEVDRAVTALTDAGTHWGSSWVKNFRTAQQSSCFEPVTHTRATSSICITCLAHYCCCYIQCMICVWMHCSVYMHVHLVFNSPSQFSVLGTESFCVCLFVLYVCSLFGLGFLPFFSSSTTTLAM